MAIWLYHVNPKNEGGYSYAWDLAQPRTLLRVSPWFVAGSMFRKVAVGDLISVYMKNIGLNPDGVYVVGTIVKVDSDDGEFKWQPDPRRSARIVESPIPPELVRKFFGRSYGHSMQQLPTTKTDKWLRLVERGKNYGKHVRPKRDKGSGPQHPAFGSTEDIRDFVESEHLAAQGFKTNPAMRKAVERYAAERARSHYEKHGFHVREHGRPFDLNCQKGRKCLYVEVKGTQSNGGEVILTPNEVDFAQKNKMELFVLHSVEVTLRGKRYVARGGVIRVVTPWRPQRGQLQPIAFRCSL